MDIFPVELSALFGEIDKRASNGGVPFEESSIVAGVSQNRSDVADVLGSGPFADGISL